MMTTKSVGASWIATAVALLVVLGGCASAGGVPSGGEMPDGATYSGLWYSDQFEHMYLTQDGDDVVGVYTYGGGGEIEGEVEGNVLLFSWHEPGDRSQARRDMSGQGYFELSGQGGDFELAGEWGYDDERRGAGPWEAEFIRERNDDDPTNLQELRDAN